MKKSRQVHLLFLSAALASCTNRLLIPSQSAYASSYDSSLMAPVDTTDIYNCCRELDVPVQQYPYVINGIYSNNWPMQGLYYPATSYRKGAFWHNHQFIVRGGFGKAGIAAAS